MNVKWNVDFGFLSRRGWKKMNASKDRAEKPESTSNQHWVFTARMEFGWAIFSHHETISSRRRDG